MTFITDDRFQSYYSEANGVWTLQIKYVQARDEGIYECQVRNLITQLGIGKQFKFNYLHHFPNRCLRNRKLVPRFSLM